MTLNAAALAVFLWLRWLSVRLCRSGESRRVLRLLCFLLLLSNTLRYTLMLLLGGFLKFPVEFSAFSYFAVPAIILLDRPTRQAAQARQAAQVRQAAQAWAAYSALMAGFFYYAAMILLGSRLYGTWPVWDVVFAMYSHGTLYVCGQVIVGTRPFGARDGGKLLGGVAYVSLRAVLLRPLVKGSEELLIYMLLDGALVRRFLPESLWGAALPAYYMLLAVSIVLSVRFFFRHSRLAYGKFSACPG